MDIESTMLLKYFISFIIIILAFPISDSIAKELNYLISENSRSGSSQKYGLFVISGVAAIIIRFTVILLSIVIAAKVSEISTIYILSSIGVLSIIVPLAFTEPLRDFACGILLIIFDKIRVGDYISVLDKFGRVNNIKAFSTTINNPYTNITTEVPNSKLWGEAIQSMYRYKDFNLHMPLLISHRNDIKMVEGAIKEILMENAKVNKVDLSYTKQDARGLSIDIAVSLEKHKGDDFGNITSTLYRSLQIGLQKRGVVFIDGSRPVSIKYKSNSVTPIIIEGTHISSYTDDNPQPINFRN
jgi:small conductance mechanosensitive channel